MPDNEKDRPSESGPSVSMTVQTSHSLPPAAPDKALTEPEAARLTTKIQLRLGMIADSIDVVLPMIEEAKSGNAHEVLGYRSWTEYVSDKFGGTLTRVGKSERLPVVKLLAGQGMSTRAIASVVGVSKSQVAEDVSSSGHLPVEATDNQLDNQVITEARTNGSNVEQKIAANNIDGIDGKSYTRPLRRSQRAAIIRDLAAQRYSSRQMVSRVGVLAPTVRKIARDHDIVIPADKVIGKTRHIDSNRIARQIVDGLDGTRMSLELINYDALDREKLAHWDASLDETVTALIQFHRTIKGMRS